MGEETLPAKITMRDLREAHQIYESHESRDIFYRVAIELIDLVRRRVTTLTLTEALAVLLKTWNASAYRFKKRKFDKDHFNEIDRMLSEYGSILERYRYSEIKALQTNDRQDILQIFGGFEDVLGPVGAAKALHLLAPKFFPLWDTKIAKAYGHGLGQKGKNNAKYWEFMLQCQTQCRDLDLDLIDSPLKWLDEFNYCKHSRLGQLKSTGRV